MKLIPHKAQLITIDVIFAFTVFLLVLQTFISISNTIPLSLRNSSDGLEIERAITWASEALVKSILVEEKNVLSSQKINDFSSLNYAEQKKLMGIPNFEFELEIPGETMGASSAIAKNAVVSQRAVIYGGNRTQITLVVWK